MLVIILPFLLAAHVTVHDDSYPDWERYGPECTYDVLVNMSLANIVHERDNFCSMISSELRCRPKGSDTLACLFTNPRIVRPSIEDARCSNARNFHPISHRFINDDPFEIRFNSRGIENLIVPRDIPRWRLDMIRAIVGQLNVGFELENSRDRFVTMENSPIGYCEVEVKVSRPAYEKRRSGSEYNGGFDITFLHDRADLVSLDEAALAIDKVRHPKRCPDRKVYFFGNHEDFSHGERNTFMDMTASTSHMYVSPGEMYSFTESTGVMRTLNRPRTMQLHQKLSISLKSISPARTAMPDITNPASTSLYAYTSLERIMEK